MSYAAAGDVCVLFSDGLIDARNQQGDGFGRERIEQIVQAKHKGSTEEIVDAIFSAVTEHSQGVATFDDQTVVVLKAKERRAAHKKDGHSKQDNG